MSMMPTMMMTDLYDTVANNPDLSTLATLLKSAGLMKGMTMMANVTLLAPNNAAFAALSPAMIATLTNASNIGTSLSLRARNGCALPFVSLDRTFH
jgi:uncharacterized surface protein with fasciclin (FAS1) repeats